MVMVVERDQFVDVDGPFVALPEQRGYGTVAAGEMVGAYVFTARAAPNNQSLIYFRLSLTTTTNPLLSSFFRSYCI